MALFVCRFRARVPALLLSALMLVAVNLPAQAQRTFSTPNTNTAINGDIVGVDNVNMNCAPFAPPPNSSTACANMGDVQCPASPTIADLQGARLAIPALPEDDTVHIELSCTVTATL